MARCSGGNSIDKKVSSGPVTLAEVRASQSLARARSSAKYLSEPLKPEASNRPRWEPPLPQAFRRTGKDMVQDSAIWPRLQIGSAST